MDFLLAIIRDESGVTVIEYAVIAMLIALVIIAPAVVIGRRLMIPFARISLALFFSRL